jgi:CRISPR-associated endonuclease Cas3-HD
MKIPEQKILNIIAKDNGELLINHSKNVSKYAVEIAKKSLNVNIDDYDNILESIRIASLLHDIGKNCKRFQDLLKNSKSEIKSKFRHNEIGWAVVKKYLKPSKSYNVDIISDTIYWHHGISNKMEIHMMDEILLDIKSKNKDDINIMISFLKYFVGDENIQENTNIYNKSPKYFTIPENDIYDVNNIKLILRTCVLSADRIVSSLDYNIIDTININDIIVDDINKKNINDINNINNFYENDRFEIQKEISNTQEKTSIIKAPAGFGKTLIGLLWSLKSKKKLLWVCPRNIVAEGVYRSIEDEISNLKLKLNIELYLSSEVKLSNNKTSGFESDIIITNIDNFLTPSFDTNKVDKLYQIMNCDIIFDEYHELISNEAIFSTFINIMKTRNRLLDVNTMLLSATPTIMNYLWDTINNKTKILPNDNTHYPAAHNKKYKIYTSETNSIINGGNNCSNLVLFNTIKNTQQYKIDNPDTIIIHSKFEDEKRKKIIEDLYSLYGKKTKRTNDKINVVAAPVIQASLDLSFQNLTESILSPESTLQRIGRIDRWGDYKNQSIIYINDLNDSSENKIKDILYNKDISNIWYNCIKNYNNKDITLDELYEIYNKFNIEHNDILKNYINNTYMKSIENMIKLYPIKLNKNVSKSDILIIGGNKLRTSNNQIFYIVKKYKSKKWSSLFKETIFTDIYKTFKEKEYKINESKIRKTLREIKKSNDDRYDYDDILNTKGDIKKELEYSSKKSNTPYLCFSKVYHDELGIIDENMLN